MRERFAIIITIIHSHHCIVDKLNSLQVFGQVTLTFRYGREDEEVMGLKFCNEAVMSLAQLYPPFSTTDRQEITTPLQVSVRKKIITIIKTKLHRLSSLNFNFKLRRNSFSLRLSIRRDAFYKKISRTFRRSSETILAERNSRNNQKDKSVNRFDTCCDNFSAIRDRQFATRVVRASKLASSLRADVFIARFNCATT